MRSAAFVLVTTLVGCTGHVTGTAIDPLGPPDAPITTPPPPPDAPEPPTFEILGPTLDIEPGSDITYCYYFHTPNTSDLAIKKWASHLTPGVHDMVVYLTSSDLQTVGTITTDKCGFGVNAPGPVWAYSTESPDDAAALPPDDGNGMPVGQPIRTTQSGFVQMHFVNSTSSVLHSHIELYAYAYADGVEVIQAGSFYTYSLNIDIPPGSATVPTSGMTNGACDVSPDSKFYLMSTHTHKQGVHSFVKDAATTVFDSTNWEHPGTATWSAPQFYKFTSGKLTYQCEYVNPNNYRIQSGDNPTTAEICIAVGYFFPSPGGAGAFCLNSSMVN